MLGYSGELLGKQIVREYAESIAWAVGLALIIRALLIEAFSIPSGSMIPTLMIGDTLYVHSAFPNKVFAIDLETQKIKWKYEPKQDPTVIPVMCCDTVNRGVAYADGSAFGNDEFVVASVGRNGVEGEMTYDPAAPAAGLYTVAAMVDFEGEDSHAVSIVDHALVDLIGVERDAFGRQ